MTNVRAKLRVGREYMGMVPPKQISTILKNGILLNFPITKSRFFLTDIFKMKMMITALKNNPQMTNQTFSPNGKKSFSNDVYDLPGGIANSKNP